MNEELEHLLQAIIIVGVYITMGLGTRGAVAFVGYLVYALFVWLEKIRCI